MIKGFNKINFLIFSNALSHSSSQLCIKTFVCETFFFVVGFLIVSDNAYGKFSSNISSFGVTGIDFKV